MRTKRLLIALLCAAIAALSACQKRSEVADNSATLATINNQKITETELKHYMQLRQASKDPVIDPAKERKAVLEEMIDRALLAQRAETIGVDKDPDVQYTLRRLRENVLVHAMVQHLLTSQPISEEELRTRFQKELKETHPTEYLVRHILLKDEDDAKEVLQELKAKGDFAALARRNSIDVSSGKNGGSLGWINEGMFVPEFFDAVTKLPKGAISDRPVKSEFGWHIIKVENTRPLKLPTYEQFMSDRETKDNFYRKLRDEKIEQLLKDLREKAEVTVNES
jgi:peptidyl-prolyl cis-trans isomerase C